jgi:hypothetical protein
MEILLQSIFYFITHHFRNYALLLLFILLAALSVTGQENKCTLKLAELPDAPELFGFRMGMTTGQLKLRVPRVALGRADDFGVLKTSISPDFDPQMDKASLTGIRTVSFDFLDGDLTSLWLGYDGSFKWKTVPDFVTGISQSLHLPDAWQTWKVRGQQLNCADFQMTVSMVAEGPSFRIIDRQAEQTVAARRQAKEEQNEAREEGEAKDKGETSETAEQGDKSELVANAKAKVYYLESCTPDNEIKEGNRVTFKTRQEAEKAGYKLAKSCH